MNSQCHRPDAPPLVVSRGSSSRALPSQCCLQMARPSPLMTPPVRAASTTAIWRWCWTMSRWEAALRQLPAAAAAASPTAACPRLASGSVWARARPRTSQRPCSGGRLLWPGALTAPPALPRPAKAATAPRRRASNCSLWDSAPQQACQTAHRNSGSGSNRATRPQRLARSNTHRMEKHSVKVAAWQAAARRC